MSATVMIINGANLNLLGTREVEIYGSQTLQEIEQLCRTHLDKRVGKQKQKWKIDFRQTNAEGALIDMVQEAAISCQALIINPGGYAHTSIALRDALLGCAISKVEVHLSNPHKREKFRQRYMSAAAVDGVIVGLGSDSYLLALDAVIAKQQSAR